MSIEETIKKKCPNLSIHRQDNMIYVFKKGTTTHHDVNYLEYLSSINELDKYIEKTILLTNKLDT
jgi:hypothetical protein